MSATGSGAPRKTIKARDSRVVDLDDPCEREFWKKWFDAPEEDLRAAIGAMGNLACDVKLYVDAQRELMLYP